MSDRAEVILAAAIVAILVAAALMSDHRAKHPELYPGPSPAAPAGKSDTWDPPPPMSTSGDCGPIFGDPAPVTLPRPRP